MAKARKSPSAHLLDFFHTHPHGRVYEVLFWGGIGVAALALAWIGVARGWMSEPLGWLLGIVGACFLAFALLPHPRRDKRKGHGHDEPPLKGKRAQIAQQVKASKAEKRKGPPPPIQ